MIGDTLKNKKGETQLDERKRPLHIGQPVLIMNTVGYANSRGSVSTGWIAGFDRYAVVLKGADAEHAVEHYHRVLSDWQAEKPSKRQPLWQILAKCNLGSVRTESVSACYLIGTTKDVMLGWEDGSLFE